MVIKILFNVLRSSTMPYKMLYYFFEPMPKRPWFSLIYLTYIKIISVYSWQTTAIAFYAIT